MDFFTAPTKRTRAAPEPDHQTASDASGSEDSISNSADEISLSESEDEEDVETSAEKRRRLAKEYLAAVENEMQGAEIEGFDAKDLDEDIINSRLRTDAETGTSQIVRTLEEIKTGDIRKKRLNQRHLTQICRDLSSENGQIFVASKCGLICSYNPSLKLTKKTQLKTPLLCTAVNEKYLAVGSHDKIFVLYKESLTLAHTFPLRCQVNALTFRKTDLYAACTDLKLRTYDLSNMSFVETLYGHQDELMDVDALTTERCVTVGGRDRTAIFWKIPEESRLTLRGGDAPSEQRDVTLEGSIDCCRMLDNMRFVTGSDNGNLRLFNTGRKKPVFTIKLAHGLQPPLAADRASAERDPLRAEIPPQLPNPILCISTIPQSNVFVTGSIGEVRIWKMMAFDRTQTIELLDTIKIGSEFVNSVFCSLSDITLAVSREPRLGRWAVQRGHDKIVNIPII